MNLDDRELAAALRLVAERILNELLLIGEKGEYALVREAADRLERLAYARAENREKHMALVGPQGETHSSLRHPAREGMPAVGLSVPMPPPNPTPAVAPRRPDRGRFVGPDLRQWQPGQALPPGKTVPPVTGMAEAVALLPPIDPGLRRIVARGLAEIMGKAVLSDHDQEVLMQAIHVVSRE
jgi:hypothetical protein